MGQMNQFIYISGVNASRVVDGMTITLLEVLSRSRVRLQIKGCGQNFKCSVSKRKDFHITRSAKLKLRTVLRRNSNLNRWKGCFAIIKPLAMMVTKPT